jgi:hypothetical protein
VTYDEWLVGHSLPFRRAITSNDWFDKTLRKLYESLSKEIDRLKAGDLTPDEFQNLCHNLHLKDKPCSRAEFEAGCRECADRIFGSKTGELFDP